jgi:hypothetical protein
MLIFGCKIPLTKQQQHSLNDKAIDAKTNVDQESPMECFKLEEKVSVIADVVTDLSMGRISLVDSRIVSRIYEG